MKNGQKEVETREGKKRKNKDGRGKPAPLGCERRRRLLKRARLLGCSEWPWAFVWAGAQNALFLAAGARVFLLVTSPFFCAPPRRPIDRLPGRLAAAASSVFTRTALEKFGFFGEKVKQKENKIMSAARSTVAQVPTGRSRKESIFFFVSLQTIYLLFLSLCIFVFFFLLFRSVGFPAVDRAGGESRAPFRLLNFRFYSHYIFFCFFLSEEKIFTLGQEEKWIRVSTPTRRRPEVRQCGSGKKKKTDTKFCGVQSVIIDRAGFQSETHCSRDELRPHLFFSLSTEPREIETLVSIFFEIIFSKNTFLAVNCHSMYRSAVQCFYYFSFFFLFPECDRSSAR